MDIFSTAVLARVVANLKRPKLFLLNSFFRQEQNEQSEEIHFEVQHGRRRIAPFVSPLKPGQIVADNGSSVTSLKPAYIKDKRQFDPSAPLRRRIGEQIGGVLSPEQRIQANLAASLLDQIETIDRRLELMATKALIDGKYTISGEGYPTKLIDFQRDPKQRVVLGSGSRWNEAGANPLDHLQDWALQTAQLTGVFPTEVVVDPLAWKAFRANAHVKERWGSLNANLATLTPAAAGDGGKFMGSIDGFDIYTYADWYVDPDDDQEKPYLPPGTVLLTSVNGLEGYRAFGAIRDEKAGYQAMPYFPKSWLEEDPAVRWLLTQSAPLIIPYRVNASLCATVL